MRRLALSLLPLGLAFLAAAFSPSARADDGTDRPADGAVDWVARLTDAEREALASHRADFAELPEAARQRTARAVVRMRDMDPERRRRLRERIERLQRVRQGDPDVGRAMLERMKRYRAMDARKRRQVEGFVRLTHVLGAAARRALDPAAREGLERADVPRRVFDMAFFRRMWKGVVEAEAARLAAGGEDAVPARARERFDRRRAAGATPAQLAPLVAHARLQEAAEGVDGPHAVAAEVRRLWPEAFDAALAEVEARADDPEALRALVGRHGRPPGFERGGPERPRLLRLALGVERSLGRLADDPALLGHGDALVRGLLVRAGLDREAVEALPPPAEREARREALRALLRGRR